MTDKDLRALGDIGEFIWNGIQALAKALNMPAEKVWGWAVKQNTVYAIHDGMWLALAALILLVGIGTLIWVGISRRRHRNDEKKYWSDYEKYAFWTGIVCIVIALAAGMYWGQELVARLVNPEWMAIQDLLAKFTELTKAKQ